MNSSRNGYKMKTNQVQNVAILFIFLIVMFPVASSTAFAASIDSIQVYGNAGVPGYRAMTDITIINVTATVPEDTNIAPSQMKILEDPTRPFDCSIIEEGAPFFQCITEYPENTLSPALSVFPFTIQLFSDSGLPLSTAPQGSMTIDSKPPKIVFAEYASKGTGLVEAHYKVTDEACSDVRCSNSCSGVASVSFTVAGTVVGEATDISTYCSQEGYVNLTGLSVGGEIGTKRVCVESSDRMGQSSVLCSDVMIDTKPPELTGIGLFDSYGMPLKFTDGKPIEGAVLKFNITENSGLFNHVTGTENSLMVDASQLAERPEQQQAYSGLQATCDIGYPSTNYECHTNGIILFISTARTLSVRIQAKDGFGNVLNDSRSLSITFDNVAPLATKIYSSFVNDKGAYWASDTDTTILMDITEATSGMNQRKVFMDFSSFGQQALVGGGDNSKLAPNECVPGWTCKWKWIKTTGKTSGSSLYLTLLAGSRDDANNLFGVPVPTAKIDVDVDKPIVDDVLLNHSNITGIGENHPPMKILTGGDMIEVHLFVKDHSGIKKAYANFSEVVENGAQEAVGECVENHIIPSESQRIFECVWMQGPLVEGYLGPEDNNAPKITFSFDDYANHTGKYEWKNIEILARENVTTRSWDAITGTGSPENGIDRLTWTLSQPRMFFPVTFKGRTGRNPVPLSLQLDPMSCSSLDYVTVNLVTGQFAVMLMNFPNYESSPQPGSEGLKDIVEIDFNPQAVPEEEIKYEDETSDPFNGFYVNCSVTVTSIVSSSEAGKKKALTLPEQVNVSFYVPVYNNKLGNNIGAIKEEMAKLADDVDGKLWEALSWLKKIFDFAQQICSMIQLLISIDSAMAMIKDIFTTTCNAPGGGAACTASSGFAAALDGDSILIPDIIVELYQVCGLLISCRMTGSTDKEMCGTGQGDWCEIKKKWASINNFFIDKLGKVWETWTLSSFQPGGVPIVGKNDFDPKRSIITSVLTLCIPGIITNIVKWREINCMKLLCYKLEVPAGKPVWKCNQQHSYLMCTYVWGQVFGAIPILQYWQKIGELLTTFFKNPWAIVGYVVNKACDATCACPSEGCAPFCTGCRTLQWASIVFNIIMDVKESTSMRFKMASYDICEQALAETPDPEKIKPPVPPSGTAAAGD